MFSNLLSRYVPILLSLLFSNMLYANEIYLIKKGDTLTTIAKEKYGDGGMWEAIYAMNKEKLLSAGKDELKLGWTLKLPDLGTKKTSSGTVSKNAKTQGSMSIRPEKQAKILPPLPQSSDYKAMVRILFLGQLEGSLMPDHKGRGGILYVDAIANKFKADNSLFLSTGDDIHGSLLANVFKGRTVIKSYNMLGLHAMNIGNHEFDYNSNDNNLENLFTLANKERDFSFLSANIKYNKNPFKPYKIYHPSTDFPIAVIGLIGKGEISKIHALSTQRMKLKISDPINEVKKIISVLNKKEKPKIIIVLSDMSTLEEEALAKLDLGIDFILGVSDKDGVKKEQRYGKTTILRLEKESGRRLGVIDIFKSENTKNKKRLDYKFYQVTTNAYETIQLNVKTNPIMSDYILKENKILNKMLNRELATTNITLIGDKYTIRTKETNLGNLVADALFEESARIGKIVDAVFINAGAIQSDIPKGKITLRMLEKALPYKNKAVILELNGEELREMFEHSISRYDDKKGNFFQVSKGFQYKISCDKKIKYVAEIKIKTKSIKSGRIYRIMVNDFIASGSDGFFMLKNKKSITPFGGKNIKYIVKDYLERKKNISPKVEKRIVFDKDSCAIYKCNKNDISYVNKMREEFNQRKSYNISAEYKRPLWEKFFQSYNQDIKCTDEDDEMRGYAKQQKEK